eukprot:Transcript_3239.p1 GENE.Transcript_3239~~Transcript_3239.p1  ORF type:complete len:1053 (-),score=318.93 Transcript_3239:183-3341(-)
MCPTAQTPLLTFPTKGGTLSLVGSTTGREVDEWFDAFALLTDDKKPAVNIQAGKPLSPETPTHTLGVRVDGEPLPHAGLQASHRATGVAVMARALPDKMPNGEAMEEVTIWSPEFELTVTSDRHEQGRHLNLKMGALPPGAAGLLAELSGVQPMSMEAKIAQISPDNTDASKKAKAQQAQQAEEADSKPSSAFDEAVLEKRAAEGSKEKERLGQISPDNTDASKKAKAQQAQQAEEADSKPSSAFDEAVLEKRAAEGSKEKERFGPESEGEVISDAELIGAILPEPEAASTSKSAQSQASESALAAGKLARRQSAKKTRPAAPKKAEAEDTGEDLHSEDRPSEQVASPDSPLSEKTESLEADATESNKTDAAQSFGSETAVGLKQLQAKRAARRAKRDLQMKLQAEMQAALEKERQEELERAKNASQAANVVAEAEKKTQAPRVGHHKQKMKAARAAGLKGAAARAYARSLPGKAAPAQSPMPAVESPSPESPSPESPSPAPETTATTTATSSTPGQLPGCHSIALISDSWCVNNCLMGNCPKDMCSEECFGGGQKTTTAAEAAASNDKAASSNATKDCHSVNPGTASDQWCVSSCSLGNCPANICSAGCKNQPKHFGPAVTQQTQQQEIEVAPSPEAQADASPAPVGKHQSRHSDLWLAKHAPEPKPSKGQSRHSDLWLAKHAAETKGKGKKASLLRPSPSPAPKKGKGKKKASSFTGKINPAQALAGFKANLTLTEAHELAEKVEALKLDLRKVAPKKSAEKDGQEGTTKASSTKADKADATETEPTPTTKQWTSKKIFGSTQQSEETSSKKTASGKETDSSKPPRAGSFKARKLTPSPAPSPEPAAAETGGCHSIAASLASDEWCMSNCALGNCPKDMCSDDCGNGARAKATQRLKVAEPEGKPCHSLDKNTASDTWCESNCALGNCPAKTCSSGCNRPAGRSAEKVAPKAEEEKADVTVSEKAEGAQAGDAEEQEGDLEDAEEQQEEEEAEPELEDEEQQVSKTVSKKTESAVKTAAKKGGGKAKSRVEVWGSDVIGRKKSTTDIKAS